MRLLDFRVQGFKSLYDCHLTDLQPINVFHGENNVGKSNLLEAMELFFRIISRPPLRAQAATEMSLSEFQQRFGCGSEIFSWDGDNTMVLHGRFQIAETLAPAAADRLAALSPVDAVVNVIYKPADDLLRVILQSWKIGPNQIEIMADPLPPAGQALLDDLVRLVQPVLEKHSFYRVRSDRRLIREEMEQGTSMRPAALPPLDPSGSNLKQWLLWASVSRDPGERRAFERVVRPMFADPPLSLGTLAPVAAPGEPYDLQLDTPRRSIPINQLGSGVQQLALLGGMIALSQSWIVAIEEPEINLSWPTQEKLKYILHRMVRQGAEPPAQLFLSSHSPVFEFYERYFKVEMEDGQTRVTPRSNERRAEEFTTVAEGRGTMIRNGVTVVREGDGVRIRSGNAVVLPERVLKALDVSQGDAIYFYRQGDQMLVLNDAQLEDLLRPPEDR